MTSSNEALGINAVYFKRDSFQVQNNYNWDRQCIFIASLASQVIATCIRISVFCFSLLTSGENCLKLKIATWIFNSCILFFFNGWRSIVHFKSCLFSLKSMRQVHLCMRNIVILFFILLLGVWLLKSSTKPACLRLRAECSSTKTCQQSAVVMKAVHWPETTQQLGLLEIGICYWKGGYSAIVEHKFASRRS